MTKKRAIVFVLPTWEQVVAIGSCWFEPVIKEAIAKGFDVVTLRGKEANKREFDRAIKDHPECFVTGIGHGSSTVYTGERYSVLLKSGRPLDIMDGCPWYALSCKVGKQLGKDVIDAGSPAFVGYDENFVFLLDPDEPCGGRPSQGFMQSNNAVVMTLLQGKTIGDAYKSSQTAWAEAIRNAQSDEEKKWLLWDKQHQVSPSTDPAYGSKDTVIVEDGGDDHPRRLVDIEMVRQHAPGWEVYGTTYEASTDNVLPDVNITIDGGERDWEETTDNTGEYSAGPIPPGTYELTAAKSGFETVTYELILEETE